jgi:hypothetical protein
MGNEQERPFNDPQHPSWYSEPGRSAPGNPYADPGSGATDQQAYGQHHNQPPQYGQPHQAAEQYPAPPYAGQPYPGQPAGQYGAYPRAGYPPAEPKTLSIIALVLGIVGIASGGFLFIPQIGAIVLGHIALRREPSGRGMAIAGLVLGYLVIALWLLFLVFMAVVFQGFSTTSGDVT